MQKLLKKFIILALISVLIGHSAAQKDNSMFSQSKTIGTQTEHTENQESLYCFQLVEDGIEKLLNFLKE